MHQGAHEMILEMIAFRDPNVVAVKAFFGDDLKVIHCNQLVSHHAHHIQTYIVYKYLFGSQSFHFSH